TCLAMGDLGGAVLHLERARRAGGRDEDIEANLAQAKTRQLDQVVGAQAEEPFVERVALATPESWATGAFLVLWALGFVGLIFRGLLPPGRRFAAVAVSTLAFIGS